MAETNATPTEAEIKAIRSDIEDYLIGGKTLEDHAETALAQFKIDLEDMRGILFTEVFDTSGDQYFTDEDGNTRNSDKCILMLSHLTVSVIYRDYAIKQGVSTWWDLANEYESRYQDRLKSTKLDVDTSGDGSISSDEEATKPQSYFRT